MTIDTVSQFGRAKIWSFFAGLFFTLILVMGVVFGVHFYVDNHTEQTRRNSSEFLNVGLARRALVEDISSVTTDLMLLSGLINHINFHLSENENALRYFSRVFITFAKQKGLYDQIRLLDLKGKEVIRVNWERGAPELVSDDKLQDKSGRYYVSRALSLDRGQVYLSPLDLNIEGGRIEQPIKPVLRFATPVFDAEGSRQGIIVLNYLGNRLLERFRQVSINIADHIQLLNSEGYWLSSPRAYESWGFMFGKEKTFQSQFPGVWDKINTQFSGQFLTEDGLFTFSTVSPVTEASRALSDADIPEFHEDAWKVVSHVPVELSTISLGQFINRYAPLYMGILALLAVLAYLIASGHVHRRRAETQHAYVQRFRQTLEDIGLVALMVDLDGKLTFCNHFLLNLTGWTYDELVGKDWIQNLIPEHQQPEARERQKKLAKKNQFPHEYESEIRTRYGDNRLISWNNTLSRDANGEVIGLTAIGEDITDSREAEEQVRKLSRAVEQSPASVIITDRKGLIEYVNPKFTQVTGYRFDEVLGKNPRILKSEETPSNEYSQLWEALNAGGEWRGEFHNRRKDGSLYWEAAVISALRDHDGDITHFLAVKEDITERKRLEQEVDARNLELARAHALTAMGRMASMLAHDLSNPLSSVKMTVQILGKQAETNEAKELASISQEQINYMEEIITEMLTYARPGELETAWLDAEKLLRGVVSTVQRRIVEFDAEVKINCAPGLPTFPGDASKLRQLLSNLIVNALQATAMRPETERWVHINVELVMTEEGRQVQFRVCDNGDGLDAKIRDQIFEPFFTTRAKGTGLGLAIVQQITDLHGGQIDLTPNEPSGTCAVLSLPMTPAVSTRKPGQVNINNQREAV